MKKLIIILTVFFSITIINTTFAMPFSFKPKDRVKEYRSPRHKKRMHKQSQKAYKGACNNKYFFDSAYGVKHIGRPTYKKRKRK